MKHALNVASLIIRSVMLALNVALVALLWVRLFAGDDSASC